MPTILKVKKLNKFAQLPSYAHEGDAGLDLTTIEAKTINPRERGIFKTGITLEIPRGYYGHICDKSGLAAKSGITVLAGIIDAGYRGEVMVVLYNTSNTKVTLARGDKIAQILIKKISEVKIKEIFDTSKTTRGKKGFGSSGR
ncbi:MAG: dUTP diphosphatase [Patescibacteria group bacterium]|nr:dUTP diphosphatase [Patescibacteria group bacterium]